MDSSLMITSRTNKSDGLKKITLMHYANCSLGILLLIRFCPINHTDCWTFTAYTGIA